MLKNAHRHIFKQPRPSVFIFHVKSVRLVVGSPYSFAAVCVLFLIILVLLVWKMNQFNCSLSC